MEIHTNSAFIYSREGAYVENEKRNLEENDCTRTTRIKKKRRTFLFADETDLKSIKKILQRE